MSVEDGTPPIALFYSRLHDGIRQELVLISEQVLRIDQASDNEAHQLLSDLQSKLKFLEQIYEYHSVAENEIVYPALDSKVKNVTLPYRIEHDDEGHLFVQLMKFLVKTSHRPDLKEQRELARKVEEVSTTIRKHLAKEEEQLFPLLLEHFSYTEQSSMIAQFLFCIPLAAVQGFLDWIQPTIQEDEARRWMAYMESAVSDRSLLNLLRNWLNPNCKPDTKSPSVQTALSEAQNANHPPLLQIVNVHRSIDLTLLGFIQEARELLENDFVGDNLMVLSEKHRFLKDVCRFHMRSEEEIMFPELLKNCSSVGSWDACHAEHLDEEAWFDDLGRLLTDARSTARRGCKEARPLMEQVVLCAEAVRENLGVHMIREEREIFPLLQEKLDCYEQCLILWRTLKMMPLRLLEQVMPWISNQLTRQEFEGWMETLKIGGMEDKTMLEILSRWAHRGEVETHLPRRLKNTHPERHVSKKRRKDSSTSIASRHSQPHPVDHIFQFHRALLRDFRLLESETNAFTQSLENEEYDWTSDMQSLKGRFTFIWGLYRAHSKTEDDVIFPALESKEETRNICHSYIADHRQEEILFQDIQQMLAELQSNERRSEIQALALKLSWKCSAVRSALETHIRAEETELWPLLIEHFSAEEQHRIVGWVIGRTGAEALQTLLPWVSTCFTEQEKEAMMASLHEATKNTRFDKWMENWNGTQSVSPELLPSQDLNDVAEYLRSNGIQNEASEVFSPSFEDMFRMNQSQLEAAVRHVSSDPSLEPQRKSYLIQRILASKYITGRQRQSTSETNAPFKSYHSKEDGILGCDHYRRKCALIAPCCKKIYVCRLCHDAEEDHKLNRYTVAEMVCMECNVQQSVAQECRNCRCQMAHYYCRVCRLFDDQQDKDIYHCPSCNICRLGKGLGIDFYHCMKCNTCVDAKSYDRHSCRGIEYDCPVCCESLFDSVIPITELRCGHLMHLSCYGHHSKRNYTCPICLKSLGDMSAYFRMLDTLLASEPMPNAFKFVKQTIYCHDCAKKSLAPFHFVYHSCQHCHSYNTRLL